MTSRFIRWVSFPAFLIIVVIPVAAQQSARTPVVSTHDRAVKLIHQSMDALGGEEKLRAIHAIEFKGIGFRNELEQSERPEGPWMPDFFQSDEIRDFTNIRYRTVRQSKTLNNTGWDNAAWSDPLVLVTVGGSSARFAQGKFSAISAAGVKDVEETLALDPLQVLLTALDASDLHAAPDAQVHGFTQQVLAFTWKSELVKVYLSSYSHLPTCIDVTRARPADYFQGPWGDVTVRTAFATWSIDPSGVRYPRQWSKDMNGQPYSTYTANEVKFNPVIDEQDFAIPEDVRKASVAPPNLNDVPLGAPNTSPLEVVPGVEYIYGPVNFNATEIRQKDGIVILEGVISSGYSAKIIEDAKRRFPGLPIKAVITTSDSWPHIGGIREYAARGIPIYALDLNRPILTRLLAAPHKLNPDALAKSPRAAKFNFVSQRTVLGSGENRIEIIPFRTVTGERQMMVYFPEAKLVYTSDLFSIRADGTLFLPEMAQEAVDAMTRENLAVDRVYGMHYNPMPVKQLRDAIAKFLTPKAA